MFKNRSLLTRICFLVSIVELGIINNIQGMCSSKQILLRSNDSEASCSSSSYNSINTSSNNSFSRFYSIGSKSHYMNTEDFHGRDYNMLPLCSVILNEMEKIDIKFL